MSVLELKAVHRTHGSGETAVHALRDVSLSVSPGELVAMMGPSGSGKSTLLNLSGGLDRPDRGTVLVDGQDLSALGAKDLAGIRRIKVGYVFQSLNLLPGLNAAENVSLPLELSGVPARKARRLAVQALSDMDLGGLSHRFPDELSGGQQQRAGDRAGAHRRAPPGPGR